MCNCVVADVPTQWTGVRILFSNNHSLEIRVVWLTNHQILFAHKCCHKCNPLCGGGGIWLAAVACGYFPKKRERERKSEIVYNRPVSYCVYFRGNLLMLVKMCVVCRGTKPAALCIQPYRTHSSGCSPHYIIHNIIGNAMQKQRCLWPLH